MVHAMAGATITLRGAFLIAFVMVVASQWTRAEGLASGKDAAIHFPPPPRLAIAPEAWAAQQASAGFAGLREGAVARGEALLKAGLTVPRGYGDWIFYYANPETGRRLEAISPTEHRDPESGEIFRDARIVNAYRMILHDRLNRDALTVAWAYRYSEDDRFAAAVRDALLQLAADYPTYPGRRDRWGRFGIFAPLGGRRYTQSLSEATGIIPLAEAYDLCRDSAAWSEQQRQTVEQAFFRATADTLLRFNQDINNHQTWYNAGLMAIANVLGDEALVRRVLDMRGGWNDQLQRSVGDDGLWYEGTMAYHFYALDALCHIADAAAPLGLALHEHPRLRAMFEAPLQAVWPDGQFPAINDSDRRSITAYARLYAWARRHYNDERFAEPVKHLDTQSRVMNDAGLAILRQGTGPEATCVMTDFGPHGGDGHGHFDKLQLLLYAGGREWLADPGRLTYSHPQYKTWVKETAAHNTVAIEGRSQHATVGRLLWFDEGEGYVACAMESKGAYAGADLRRWLVLCGDLLIDRFEVVGRDTYSMDWMAHVRADELRDVTLTPLADALGQRDGYQHLTSVRSIAAPEAGSPLRLTWTSHESQQPLVMWLLGGEGDRFMLADSIGYSVDEVVPCLVWRRQAQRSVFIAVYDLAGGDAVRGIASEDDGATIQIDGANERVRVTLDAAGAQVTHAALR